MALLFRGTTLITSVFCRSTPSSIHFLRSSTVLNFQKKVFTASILCEKSTKADGDVQTSQVQAVQDTCTTSSSINTRKIHLGSILHTSGDAVFKYFSKYGEVEMLEFFHSRFSKAPRGFAFVTFSDVETAQRVLAESHVIDGQNITVGLPFTDKNVIVLVTNILNATSKEVIAKHFSQFGKVDKVILAQKDDNDDDVSSYYVIFSSLTGVRKALEEPTQRIADQGIDSEVTQFLKTQDFKGKTTRVRLTSVPDNLTVNDLRNYFQKFVDLEYIELFKNSLPITELNSNVAYVHFANESTVEEIVSSKNHIISGSTVEVSKCGNMQGDQKSSQKLRVLVEGFPSSAKLLEIKKFFRQTFEIVPSIVCFKRDTSVETVLFVVRFLNQRELENALKKTNLIFGGSPLYFHPLVWRKEGFETEQHCRVPSTADTGCCVLEFARSTTVKYKTSSKT